MISSVTVETPPLHEPWHKAEFALILHLLSWQDIPVDIIRTSRSGIRVQFVDPISGELIRVNGFPGLVGVMSTSGYWRI